MQFSNIFRSAHEAAAACGTATRPNQPQAARRAAISGAGGGGVGHQDLITLGVQLSDQLETGARSGLKSASLNPHLPTTLVKPCHIALHLFQSVCNLASARVSRAPILN